MTQSTAEQVDVVVIGAGFSGLYALHRLGADHSVVCFEAGDGVGGTWYWNRYPGARLDIVSVEYSCGFDEDLQQEWHWPEYFSTQPELEKYANHFADRFDLRQHIRFANPVTRLRFDSEKRRWHVHTASRPPNCSARPIRSAANAWGSTTATSRRSIATMSRWLMRVVRRS